MSVIVSTRFEVDRSGIDRKTAEREAASALLRNATGESANLVDER